MTSVVNGATPVSQVCLSVREISKRFGGVLAVANVTFDVRPGAVTGLIGPNGAGKSTALNIIAGALAPSSGHVFLHGESVTGLPPHRLARLGVSRTFQMSSEFASLTVLENLLCAGSIARAGSLTTALFRRRLWRREERVLVSEALERLDDLGLGEHANEPAGALSGGQKRLLELGRVLMTKPTVLLLDEPFAGLSPVISEHVEELLLKLTVTGLAVLLVEHQLALIERVCETVVVMAQGRVVSRGSMSQLRENPEVVDAYLAG